ncbi:hypothetical protein PR003_g29360 [Phytophthora rubi]|uniref:Uncharacterized protein n=1 Tax=Phytophthora rubi TaxID=129364 RepID=A0A6A3HD32_9STRA|nr:hypothetical protein PR002_g28264 [Phytophthora rubi]KAE8967087.1 hypothetical protein PR001_g28204 [Phytophthora rubi]KAE9275347.1 hypothetical protein PR003_g29360 [Phytophthora rubi]
MKTFEAVAIAVTLVFALLTSSVSAWYGTVTFYQDVDFDGSTFPWGITKSQRCYNLACWDNKASSVKWKGLPSKGSINGQSRIAFYTDKNCKGDVRHWPTDVNGHYPKDFTLDFVNDQITSFMIWTDNQAVSGGYDTPCPWGTR